MPKLTSDAVPLNPYRIIWDLMHTLDPHKIIITHDSGSPRDQLAPFYQAVEPRGLLDGASHMRWGLAWTLLWVLNLLIRIR